MKLPLNVKLLRDLAYHGNGSASPYAPVLCSELAELLEAYEKVAEIERTRDAIQADANRALENYRANMILLRDDNKQLQFILHEYDHAALERQR